MTTPPPLTQADLQARLHSHLAGHYLQIHGTLVSIALGAAAFAAASLGMPEHGQPDGGVLPWLLCAVLGIVRARILVGPSRFDVSASAAATYYRQRLSRDTEGAASLVVVSGLGGAFRAAGVPSASAWSYVFASAALCIMVVGLVMHEITGRRLRTLIG